MRKLAVILVGMFSAWSLTAFATEYLRLQQGFHTASTAAARILDARGVHRVAGFDVKKFILKVPSVKYVLSPVALRTQDRLGHRYNQGIVTISEDFFLEASRVSNQTVLMHETLGALGYDDKNYQISALIEAFGLSLVDPSFDGRTILQIISQLAPEPIQLTDGGITEIGGGGDPYGAYLKTLVLLELLRRKVPLSQFMNFTNRVVYETFLDYEGNRVYDCPLDFKGYRGIVFKRIEQGTVKVFFPAFCFMGNVKPPVILINTAINIVESP